MKLVFVMKTIAPLLIVERYVPSGPEPLIERVPGSSISGALARKMIKIFNVDRSALTSYAMNGDYVFGDAYPIVGEEHKLSMPTPGICIELKLYSQAGFRSSILCPVEPLLNVDSKSVAAKMEECLNIVRDHLTDRGIPYAGVVKSTISRPVIFVEQYTLKKMLFLNFRPIDVVEDLGLELRDSVAISPWMRRGEEPMLFSYSGIASNTLWWGVANIRDDLAEKLLKSQPIELEIGRGRTRGFGRTLIVLKDVNVMHGDSSWYMVWTPTPMSRYIEAYLPREKSIMWVKSWSQIKQLPRISMNALRPGTIVWLSQEPADVRFRGLLPPWGQLEKFSKQTLLPPTVTELSSIVSNLISSYLR